MDRPALGPFLQPTSLPCSKLGRAVWVGRCFYRTLPSIPRRPSTFWIQPDPRSSTTATGSWPGSRSAVLACTTDRQWGRIIGDGELALSGGDRPSQASV